MRFQDRLTVSYAVAPETLDAMVPNLVWQPIVENAIRHAIAPAPGRATSRSVLSEQVRNFSCRLRMTGPAFLPTRTPMVRSAKEWGWLIRASDCDNSTEPISALSLPTVPNGDWSLLWKFPSTLR